MHWRSLTADQHNKVLESHIFVKKKRDVVCWKPDRLPVKTSPAVDHLFTARDPSLAKVLPEEPAMAFHRTMAQLLFLSVRVR